MQTDGTENPPRLLEPNLVLDQPVVLGCLSAIAFLCWLYLLNLLLDMSDTARRVMSGIDNMSEKALVAAYAPWSVSALLITASMWIVMMSAMMLPTAIPMILVFADDRRERASLATPAFVLGYVLVWIGYALAAVALHWTLLRHGLFQPAMKVASPILGGFVFVAAGIYEWSSLKVRCLAKCRNTREFLASHWRPGVIGSLHAGLQHGGYCVACCWGLMLLLFAVGALNLIWVAALSLLVLLQKLLPRGEWIARASGFVMLAIGIYLVVAQGMP